MVYNPGVPKILPGFWMLELTPPRFQDQETIFPAEEVDWSKKVTCKEPQPEVALAEKSASTCAKADVHTMENSTINGRKMGIFSVNLNPDCVDFDHLILNR